MTSVTNVKDLFAPSFLPLVLFCCGYFPPSSSSYSTVLPLRIVDFGIEVPAAQLPKYDILPQDSPEIYYLKLILRHRPTLAFFFPQSRVIYLILLQLQRYAASSRILFSFVILEHIFNICCVDSLVTS